MRWRRIECPNPIHPVAMLRPDCVFVGQFDCCFVVGYVSIFVPQKLEIE